MRDFWDIESYAFYDKEGMNKCRLVTYPGGSCFEVIEPLKNSRIILKLDDSGFGKLTKFLVSHFDNEPMPEVVIHGFRVTYQDYELKVSGNVISSEGKKSEGELSVRLEPDQFVELVDMMVKVNSEDGLTIWSAGEKLQLRLVLSHKNWLQFAVYEAGERKSSQRLVYYPSGLMSALHDFIRQHDSTARVNNPWHKSVLSFRRNGGGIPEVVVNGHLADETGYGAMVFPLTTFDSVHWLTGVLRDYFVRV